MISVSVCMYNTVCKLSFDQMFAIYCDFFKGEFDIGFSNLKGTEFGNVIENVKQERKNSKYLGNSKLLGTLQLTLAKQLPKKLASELNLSKLKPNDVTSLIMKERANGRYFTRKDTYRQLIDFIHGEILDALDDVGSYSSKEYLEAVKWRKIECEILKNEIEKRKLDVKIKMELEELDKVEEMQKCKREEWLELRNKRIIAEMNELDEEIFVMEKKEFEAMEKKCELGNMIRILKGITIKMAVFEAKDESERKECYWPFYKVETKQACHLYYMTRTFELDCRITNPYHIYMIHQIMQECSKAYRTSWIKQKEWEVLMYLLDLDPDPDVEFRMHYHDVDKMKIDMLEDENHLNYEF